MPNWVTALFKPISDIVVAREQRKQARQTAKTKVQIAKENNSHTLELNKDEWEALQVKGMDTTWKDEYVTVSVVSIFNIIVVGGVAAAFGQPQLMEGMAMAITALTAAGVDVGFLLEATILAGLGLSIWKRA